MNKLYIGIDVGVRRKGMGIAILDENKELRFIDNLDTFEKCIAWVMNDLPEHAIVGVENSNKQSSQLFALNQHPYKGKNIFSRKDVAILTKIAMSVGKNQMASQYICNILPDYCKKVYSISPKEKGAKWDIKTQYYRRVIEDIISRSGYHYTGGKLSQDAADAFKILELTKTMINYESLPYRNT